MGDIYSYLDCISKRIDIKTIPISYIYAPQAREINTSVRSRERGFQLVDIMMQIIVLESVKFNNKKKVIEFQAGWARWAIYTDTLMGK